MEFKGMISKIKSFWKSSFEAEKFKNGSFREEIFYILFKQILFYLELKVEKRWWEYLSAEIFSWLLHELFSSSELLHFNKMWRIFFPRLLPLCMKIQTLLYFSQIQREEKGVIHCLLFVSLSSSRNIFIKHLKIVIRSTKSFPALFSTAKAKTFVMVIERSDFAFTAESLISRRYFSDVSPLFVD